MLMSHIFGIIASDTSVGKDQVERILADYCTLLEKPGVMQRGGSEVDLAHGALLSIGYLLGRCNYRNRDIDLDLVRRCIRNLYHHLEGAPSATFTLLASAACRALAEIGRSKLFPIPAEVKKEEKEDDTASATADAMAVDKPESLSILQIIQRIHTLVKSGKEPKIQEQAILALAHISIPLGPNEAVLSELILDALYASADTKQVELFLAGGEAWSIVAFGWDSQAMQKHKDLSDMPVLENRVVDEDRFGFQKVIEKIARVYVASDRSWYRKAACIWLLSILKFGKDQELIKVCPHMRTRMMSNL